MSEANVNQIDASASAALRRSLAEDARRFVADDPVVAVERFRERVQPFVQGGRAWIVEPAIRVLITELRRDEATWRRVGDDAEQLLIESDEGQENAIELALTEGGFRQAGSDVDRELVNALEASAAVRLTGDSGAKRSSAVEQVQVKWAHLDQNKSDLEQILDSLVLRGGLTLLGSVTGSAAERLSNDFSVQPSHSSLNALRLWFHEFPGRNDDAHLLRRRILSAMFYVPPDRILLTVVRGQQSRIAAEVYLAHFSESWLERLRSYAIRIVNVGVRRPAHLDEYQAVALAKQFVGHEHEINAGPTLVDKPFGIQDIRFWMPGETVGR